MNPQSLLIILTNPPQIRVQENLLEDYVSTEIDGVPVFATVAPWGTMHDLLIDRETQVLAGIIYAVREREQAAVAAICQSMPAEVVRYCISLSRANAAIHSPNFRVSYRLDETGDPNVPVKQFPEVLRPYRQAIRGYLLGGNEQRELTENIRIVAADYFDEFGGEEWTSRKSRVEVTWINKPVIAKLPSYFPSAFEIELAQYFAEDIWYYREDNNQPYAIGFNYLDKTLDDYGLQLPEGLKA